MIKPSLFLLTLLAAALTLSMCKRSDGDTLCEGTVVDKHDNTRVANAMVGVYVAGQSGGLGGGYVLKEEHQADASGNFAFQIGDDANGMLLRASTSLGHYTPYAEAPSLRGGKNNKDLVVRVQAPAWLRVNIVSQPPHDTAAISFGGSLPSIGTGILYGRDTTILMMVQGNTSLYAYWRITRQYGNQTNGSQDVYCPGLDTTSIQVTY